MRFLGKEIGQGHPVFVIAEAGINHNGDLAAALKMVEIAKECGADAVKFQKRDLETLYRSDVLAAPSEESHSLGVYIPILRQCELNEVAHRKLKQRCDDIDIKYLCSPWDIPSLEFLEDLGVEGYKVPSACFSDPFLIDAVAATGKPVVLSTGMHCSSEIINLMGMYWPLLQGRVALMHCISSYPTANRDVNLGYIQELKDLFENIPVGYSGHERGVPISVAAVARGANLIERHFTLDRTQKGPDHASSLEPHGLEELVRHIRAVEEALGDRKNINQGEVVARETLGKVLTWAYDLPAGAALTLDSFRATSPGYGIPPYKAHEMLAMRTILSTAVAVKEGTVVRTEQVLFDGKPKSAAMTANFAVGGTNANA